MQTFVELICKKIVFLLHDKIQRFRIKNTFKNLTKLAGYIFSPSEWWIKRWNRCVRIGESGRYIEDNISLNATTTHTNLLHAKIWSSKLLMMIFLQTSYKLKDKMSYFQSFNYKTSNVIYSDTCLQFFVYSGRLLTYLKKCITSVSANFFTQTNMCSYFKLKNIFWISRVCHKFRLKN